MIQIPNAYRKAFYAALGLHLGLIVLLCFESSHTQAVLTADNKNTAGMMHPIAATSQPEIVKAVSVDNTKLMQQVNQLKQAREQQKQVEINKQKELDRQAALAKQERLKEQQRIAQLKEEANKIAILRKKQALEEKKHLKELEEKKALEAKHLKELQEQKEKLIKQQQIEQQRLAQLNKKKEEEREKAQLLKQAKAAEQQRLEKQAQAAAAAAAKEQAENQARLAGVVDKYKAMILNAIERHWIVPENVDRSLYSLFRIRLAPDGSVLEVSLIRSSGDTLLDRSAQTAIYKASPLPVPSDSETFNLFRDISLTVRPEQVRG